MPRLCAVLAIAVAVIATAVPASAQAPIGQVGKVAGKAYGATLDRSLRPGEPIRVTQPISTGDASAVELRLDDGTGLYIGEQSHLNLDLTPSGKSGKTGGAITLSAGSLRVMSTEKFAATLRTPAGTFTPESATFTVLSDEASSEIAVQSGTVKIATRLGEITVEKNGLARISTLGPPEREAQPSIALGEAAIAIANLLDAPDLAPEAVKQRDDLAKAYTELEATPAFKDAIKGKTLSNLLYLDTTAGRIVIEMQRELAPNHVARIKDLVRAKFYDGLTFHNVVPGFVAETGDPTGTGFGGSGATMKAETGTTAFVRGVVAMKHDRDAPNSARTQFFILLGAAPQFDGHYTAWGHVIFGLDAADKLHAGSPPAQPDRIVAAHLAADPPLPAARNVPCRASDRRLGSCKD